jgi:SAM-dependent methyltransferase
MSSSFWDERFSGPEYTYGVEPNDFLRAEAGRIPKGRVLCVAEGEGRNSTFLAALGYEVTAVDFSIEGLRKAERLARERGVAIEFIHADLATYEPPVDSFAGVVSIFAHTSAEVRRRLHSLVPRALRIGGCFILEAYRHEQVAFGTGGPRDPALLMALAELREDLAPLDLVIAREVERDIQEGPAHGGHSATVQIVGIRAAAPQ